MEELPTRPAQEQEQQEGCQTAKYADIYGFEALNQESMQNLSLLAGS